MKEEYEQPRKDVDPDEVIRKLKILLERYDEAIRRCNNYEEKLSDTSLS